MSDESRLLHRLLSPRRALPERIVIVLIGLFLAMGLRALLSPWLGESFPLMLAFPVVAVVSVLAGVVPALVLATLCMVWLAVPWLPPDWPDPSVASVVALALALGITAIVGLLRERPTPLLSAAPPEMAPNAQTANRGALHSLRVSMVVAALLPISLFVLLAWQSYTDAIDTARVRVEATVRVASEHAARVIETNQVITNQLLEALGDDEDAAVLAREQQLHERLKRLAASLPQVQSIWVWGADGRPLVSHRFYPAPRTINVSDRQYFQWHQANATGWYVTQTLRARATGELFFDITHRRQSSDGRFLGVVSVSLHPGYFTSFYERFVHAEPGLALALVRTDGAVIARWPAADEAVAELGADSAVLRALHSGRIEGWVDGLSSGDEVPRLAWFHRIEDVPLMLVGALDRHAVQAAWAREVAALGAVTLFATIALVLVLWVALRRAQLELVALERLQAESEQRRRAEDALRQAQKMEALGRLTGGVAHDFNNLLTVVNNNAFLLNHLLPRGQHDAQVAGILRAVKAGEKLTRQLLAFSRRQALRPEVIDLQDALPDMEDLLRTTLGRRVELSIQVAPDAPAVEVDRAELELALLNLALNARDAMAEVADRPRRLALIGRRALKEELPRLLPGRSIEPDAVYAVVSVADTGAGIDPAIADRIFEPFFTTKGPGEGTGLGLSQVYGFCQQAGGGARVDSTPGQGTTVSIVLPASTRPRPRDDVDHEEPAPDRIDAHVMLVEDNDEVAATTSSLLAGFGAKVTCASSARAALERIDATPHGFDIVLSDVVMPGGMSGLDLARTLRERLPELPVVLITGYTAEIHQAMAAGFQVLSKPCAPSTLSAALSRALQPATR